MGVIGCIIIVNVFFIIISEFLRLIKRIYVVVFFFCKKVFIRYYVNFGI